MSIVLSIVGLGFLILIHELGHYLTARRVGIRVDVFSIGFGRAIYSFLHGKTKVCIGWIPFGGYVKLAGSEPGQEDVPGGYFSKSPIKRIWVALWGPLANILFALLAFSVIWFSGGRPRSFGELNDRIGWIDPSCEMYAKGARAGDRVLSYNARAVHGEKDHLQAAMTSGSKVRVEIEKLFPVQGQGEKIAMTISPYQHPLSTEKGILTTGVLSSADFLVWNPLGAEYETAAQKESGIQRNDRIVWVDGKRVFSHMQLRALLNDNTQLVSVLRGSKQLLLRVPRLLLGEMKIPAEVRGEISDWKYESGLERSRFSQMWFMPYDITSDGVVEKPFALLDKRDLSGDILLANDKIVAVGTEPVEGAAQILSAFQQKKVLVVVDRTPLEKVSVERADELFRTAYQGADLAALIHSIAISQLLERSGSLVLLNPIAPTTFDQLCAYIGRGTQVEKAREHQIQRLEQIEDPEVRASGKKAIEQQQQQLFLGLFGIHDVQVLHNPNPFEMMYSSAGEIWRTFSALFGGYISPKWMAGPVGIVHVMQRQWSIGVFEALFWLGTISLNLAILNLLPLPVLDGGHILLALVEKATGMKVKAKTLEKIIWPFALAFILFLLYLTYHDLMRVFLSWKG